MRVDREVLSELIELLWLNLCFVTKFCLHKLPTYLSIYENQAKNVVLINEGLGPFIEVVI